MSELLVEYFTFLLVALLGLIVNSGLLVEKLLVVFTELELFFELFFILELLVYGHTPFLCKCAG